MYQTHNGIDYTKARRPYGWVEARYARRNLLTGAWAEETMWVRKEIHAYHLVNAWNIECPEYKYTVCWSARGNDCPLDKSSEVR